jgi:hypothetical protein
LQQDEVFVEAEVEVLRQEETATLVDSAPTLGVDLPPEQPRLIQQAGLDLSREMKSLCLIAGGAAGGQEHIDLSDELGGEEVAGVLVEAGHTVKDCSLAQAWGLEAAWVERGVPVRQCVLNLAGFA